MGLEPTTLPSRTQRVMASYPIFGSDFSCVPLWLILYISRYSIY